ncbi:uracil-DNA glycosylase, partial [bacterium]|nr:uracil-DNA glycosylase [bacterium]
MIDFDAVTPYSEMSYEEMVSVCRDCTKCGLHSTRTHVVVGNGPVPSNLMIVGEGPGETEDLQGLPFVGKAGQLLTKILESVGINRDTDTYITNTVKCRPPQNRTPLLSEMEACKPYLIRQIQLVKPRILVLLGSPSLKNVLDEMRPISQVRGKWYTANVAYMDEPLYIMAIFHPSYLLRNQSREKGSPKWLTWMDAKEVKTALDFYSTTVADS